MGRLTKKIQCQLRAWVITPPASRPIEAPAEATKLKTPMAFAWSAGSVNIVMIMPRMTEEVMAPPAPWMKRETTSTVWSCARPHAIEDTVKRAMPARKTFFRPIRSPSRPASRSSPPKAIR